jgi:hypothetical protein
MKHKKVLELFKKDLIKNLEEILDYKESMLSLDTFPYENDLTIFQGILEISKDFEEPNKKMSSYAGYFSEVMSILKKASPSQEDYKEMNFVFDIFHKYASNIDYCAKCINELSIHQRGLPTYAIEKNMQNAKSGLKPILLLTPITDNLQELSESLDNLKNKITEIEKNYLYSIARYSGGHWTPGSGHSR